LETLSFPFKTLAAESGCESLDSMGCPGFQGYLCYNSPRHDIKRQFKPEQNVLSNHKGLKEIRLSEFSGAVPKQ